MLRTPESWLLIDFEGEPGQPLDSSDAEIRRCATLAGVLRSFRVRRLQALVDPGHRQTTCRSPAEWVSAIAHRLLRRLRGRVGNRPRDSALLLSTYELDKAVYETGYETQHRPGWLPIPAFDRPPDR